MDNVRSLDLDIKTDKCSVMYVLQGSSELSFSALWRVKSSRVNLGLGLGLE